MVTATNIVQRIPLLGKMFSVDTSTGLEEINAWPSLMVLTSFVWLAVAGLLGVALPLTQLLGLDSALYYTALTAHGAALAFPFLFQLMIGVSLHRTAGCLGRPVTGWLPALIYIFMNVGSVLLTLAILGGLKISYALMYPLPIVGVQTGQWSMDVVILGFTGIALVITTVIVLYPVQVLWMLFFGREREDLVLERRTLRDPGMLGMAMAVLVLLVAGIPILIIAGLILLGLYGVIPLTAIAWATEPVVFQFAFFIFAHNLMEAMAIMIVAAVYATLPLYLADGTRKLFSDRLAKLALWILLVASLTSFFHHFFTMFPAMPSALAYHGNIMSWATGIGGALTIFTILATIWKHGLKPEPGTMALLMGFALYILDGVSAVVTSNVAWSFQIHGTMWQAGHTMGVLVAITLMWMGVFYHHYPVITGRRLNRVKGNWFVVLYSIGAAGAFYSFLAAGVAGMPRRFAAWDQEGWMVYGNLVLIFGLLIAAGLVVFAWDLLNSREIETSPGEQTVAAE
ncbi:MAG: cbb3-type cytochrome c oxidase subunit I [Alphaproteobacteria bacterium]|nr:cbb3-type cytochrome c oxidase subunit I [Alphaproteobacteria bacterium]MDP6255974.1 cbb3-type cytochrome c oxidase subunit I [Alphaproteobacteria bacterium]MDP7054274.1 cbb3-type cytochrome c oxidase subunit I [Alphaproteobacteria bacterium]MDP7229932.1 cbb3-type cytochrome c oxidase subunit I [Alphaproteobacteria bacterium]MDP7460051.1 cbb3-type cytochrome c oxidase subunit I [Alphaproteobacteria bacterium]